MRRWTMAAAMVGALALASCGGKDEKPSADSAAVPVKGVDYGFVMPDRVAGPVVRFDFSNAGRAVHEYSFGSLGAGKTAGDVLALLHRAEKTGNEPHVPWLKDLAGVPVLTPGAHLSITRRVLPGRYVFLCFIPGPNGKPHYDLGMIKVFTVVAGSDRKLPRPDAVITARNRSFEVPALHPGTQTVELRNQASGPREFNLISPNPGRKAADLQRWGNSGFKGPAPAQLLGAMQSIPPRASVFLTIDLAAGRTYFLTDEENHLRAQFSPKA